MNPLARSLLTLAMFVATPAHADAIDEAFAPWSGADRPGCAVAISQSGLPPVVRAYGMADLERRVPVTPDTVFETGSVAKQVTAAAVLMLAEDGRLSLDDDIRRYLPEMPDYGTPITIDHLLTHTSGLRDWSDLVDFTGWPRYTRVYSNADALLVASRQRALNHRPGERFSYTNTGYNLLAIIVERVTGQSLARFTEARIFRPLRMVHSGWRDDYRRIVPGRAIGYVRDEETLVTGAPLENAYGSGGMLSTVGDLIKWGEALDLGTLGPFVTAKLQEPARLTDGRVTTYGRGLMLGRYRGQPEIFHNGGTNGYQAWVGRYPDQALLIAMMCNGRTIGPDTQVRRIAALYLPGEAARLPAARPAEDELGRRAGLYVGAGPLEILRIVARNGRLETQGGTHLPFIAPGRYRLGASELRFSERGVARHLPDGEVRPLTQEVEADRTPLDLAGLAGRYVNDEVLGAYDLEPRDGALMLIPAGRPDGTLRLTPLIRDGFAGPGFLMRILRGADGRVTGLRFQTARVYELDFSRIDAIRPSR